MEYIRGICATSGSSSICNRHIDGSNDRPNASMDFDLTSSIS